MITEEPGAWRNDGVQVVEGWTDCRLVLPSDGHIFVGHKFYPGADLIGHTGENYLGQLETYSRALEPVDERRSRVLVHLPLLTSDLALRHARTSEITL